LVILPLAIRLGIDKQWLQFMRKSRDVPITLLAALAISTTGCDPASASLASMHRAGIAPEGYCQNQSTGYTYVMAAQLEATAAIT